MLVLDSIKFANSVVMAINIEFTVVQTVHAQDYSCVEIKIVRILKVT